MASSVWHSPPRLRGCHRLLALTLRPPDLLAAAGGLIQRLAADGAPVDVLLATDGDRAGGAAYSRLGLPDLVRHRLALSAPLGAREFDDLVAALSELVGFDPEPGLFLLGPSTGDSDANRVVAGRAAEHVAAVYHLPLLRYVDERHVDERYVDEHGVDAAAADPAAADPAGWDETAVSRFDLDPTEWGRKRKALTVYGAELAARCSRTEAFFDARRRVTTAPGVPPEPAAAVG